MLLVLIFVLGFAGCADAKVTKIRVSGSSTVMPLAELSAEEFNLMQDDYHVSVTSGGTGVGIIDVAEGRSDIAMASREIKPVERMRYETGDDKFQEFLVGYDAVCLVVSPAVYEGGVTSLTKDQVKEIYAGDIINWKEVGGPDIEIFAIGRREGSGTRDTFNEVIMGSKEAEAPGVTMEAGENSEIKYAVSRGDNAIGYIGYSYVLHGDTKVLSLDGILPTIEAIKSGKYPLARKLYFYTLGIPKPGALAFMNFISSSGGQKIAEENGFVPTGA